MRKPQNISRKHTRRGIPQFLIALISSVPRFFSYRKMYIDSLYEYCGLFEAMFELAPEKLTYDDFETWHNAMLKLQYIGETVYFQDCIYEYFSNYELDTIKLAAKNNDL